MIESTKNRLAAEAFSIKERLDTDRYASLHTKYPFAIVKNDQLQFKSDTFTLQNLRHYLHSGKTFVTFEGKESLEALYILKFKKPFDGAIVVSESDIDETFENLTVIIIGLESILFLLFLLLARRMVDRIIKPVQNINRAAREITIDNFQHKIAPVDSGDEIEDLVETFNTMIERLKDGVVKLDRFNSDVSHELKTPLTVIHGHIELALKKDRDNNYYKKSLETIAFEADKIRRIVEALLLLSRYSRENIKQNFSQCDFNALLLEVVEHYLPKAEAKQIDMQIVRFEKVTKEANLALISAIFSNLIDNAIKYTPPHKKIEIALYRDEKIHFIVLDEGVGIPKTELDKITDRFYRVDASRNKEIEGFGLGLSIVKNSVELHEGELKISSKLHTGTTVEVLL